MALGALARLGAQAVSPFLKKAMTAAQSLFVRTSSAMFIIGAKNAAAVGLATGRELTTRVLKSGKQLFYTRVVDSRLWRSRTARFVASVGTGIATTIAVESYMRGDSTGSSDNEVILAAVDSITEPRNAYLHAIKEADPSLKDSEVAEAIVNILLALGDRSQKIARTAENPVLQDYGPLATLLVVTMLHADEVARLLELDELVDSMSQRELDLLGLATTVEFGASGDQVRSNSDIHNTAQDVNELEVLLGVTGSSRGEPKLARTLELLRKVNPEDVRFVYEIKESFYGSRHRY